MTEYSPLDYRSKGPASIIAPGEDCPEITPSDTTDLPTGWCRAIYCNTAGTFVGITIAGNERTVTMQAGGTFLCGFRRIKSSGTTGTYLAIY